MNIDLLREKTRQSKSQFAPGHVYFITLGTPAIWVKIGFTALSPVARLKALQVGCPYPMTLRGFVTGTRLMEEGLHRRLAEYRRSGEWFEVSDEVERVIAEVLGQ